MKVQQSKNQSHPIEPFEIMTYKQFTVVIYLTRGIRESRFFHNWYDISFWFFSIKFEVRRLTHMWAFLSSFNFTRSLSHRHCVSYMVAQFLMDRPLLSDYFLCLYLLPFKVLFVSGVGSLSRILYALMQYPWTPAVVPFQSINLWKIIKHGWILNDFQFIYYKILLGK